MVPIPIWSVLFGSELRHMMLLYDPALHKFTQHKIM